MGFPPDDCVATINDGTRNKVPRRTGRKATPRAGPLLNLEPASRDQTTPLRRARHPALPLPAIHALRSPRAQVTFRSPEGAPMSSISSTWIIIGVLVVLVFGGSS